MGARVNLVPTGPDSNRDIWAYHQVGAPSVHQR